MTWHGVSASTSDTRTGSAARFTGHGMRHAAIYGCPSATTSVALRGKEASVFTRRDAFGRRISRVPHWLAFGGPFASIYKGPWFFRWRPQYRDGWRWGLGHRMGGFYLIELGPLRIGKHFRP